MSIKSSIIAVVIVVLMTASTGKAGNQEEHTSSRKLRAWGGYSGSWSGSWGSSSVNVQPGGQSSGSVNTPYYSGTWGNGGSSGTTSTQSTTSNPPLSTPSTASDDAEKAQKDKDMTAAQAPGKVYYNGYGVLVEKLANGSTLTVVNNNYTDVTVLSNGKRRV